MNTTTKGRGKDSTNFHRQPFSSIWDCDGESIAAAEQLERIQKPGRQVMRIIIIMLGVCGVFLCGPALGQESPGQETVVTNLVVEGYLAVEGTIEQGDSMATGAKSTALGNQTTAAGNYSQAVGNQTVAAAAASHAGGAFARVRPEDTNAFIHATGASTNEMKETRFPNTAHFDHIVTLSPALDDAAAILSRGENDARYFMKAHETRAGRTSSTGTVSSTQYLNPNNTAMDLYSLVIGGFSNLADDFSVVAGGQSNVAARAAGTNGYAFVGGGSCNTARMVSAIGGGLRNLAEGQSAIGGGNRNTARNMSFVGGGENNIANPTNSDGAAFIGGGGLNQVYGDKSSIVGGSGNIVSNFSSNAVIWGGSRNLITGNGGGSVIGGGYSNIISISNVLLSPNAFIGGGSLNRIENRCATISGGFSNLVSGAYGTAGGFGAQAVHDGTWVWADAQGKPFASSASNEFAIRAGGGVRLEAKLLVNGEASFNGPILIRPAGDVRMGIYTNGAQP